MDPRQKKKGNKKLTVEKDARGKPIASLSAVARPAKRPRTTSSIAPSQVPQFQNDLQKSRYDLFQGSKYVSGRQVDKDAYANADFYPMVMKYLEDMGWLGLATLSEMHLSPLLVNEFYFGIVLKAKEYENLVVFDKDVIYTYFDGKKWVLK